MFALFWNQKESRLRAFWRLLIHSFLLFTGLIIANIGLVLVAMVSGDPAELLQSGEGLEHLIGNLIATQPVLVIASSVLTLLSFLLATWLAGRFLDRRRFVDFGFHFSKLWWLDLLFGLALGALLMGGVFLFQRAAGWVEVTSTFAAPGGRFWAGILAAGVLFIGTGIQEELLSRGYHLRNLAEGFNSSRFGPRRALLLAYLLSSAVFSLLHILNPNSSLISTLNLLLAGLFLGFGYLLTGELAIPIGLHITWNFFQGNVFGFPVSGQDFGVTFIQIQQGGPDLWTGGPFGPEAGLLGIAAMLAGSLLTFAWVRLTRGKAHLQLHLAEYHPQEAPSPTPR
jgi:uncharacterized protein